MVKRQKDNMTNNDLPKKNYCTQKTNDQTTRTPLKTGGETECSGRVTVTAPLMAPVVIL